MKEKEATKRNILSELAYVYDPIGLISPAHVLGKLLYREICDLKLPCDKTVSSWVNQKWERWKLDISNNRVKTPRSIPTKLESVAAWTGTDKFALNISFLNKSIYSP